MGAWQSVEVLESTPAITPRNSSAQTPGKRLLWFITGNMARVEADGVLTIRAMAHVPHAGAKGESPGSRLGSTALFFPWFIISCKYTFTRMLQLLKLPSLQAWHKAHSRNAEVRISEAILWGDTVNVTFWSSPHFLHCNFLDNSIAYFPMTGPNPNYMFTQPTWNSGFDECVFSF